MKQCILLFTLVLVFIPLSGTERVGGWIHNDTVWTAVNSPYIVHSFLYIASGVTLTLEPGVQVLVMGAPNSVDCYMSFFWTGTASHPIEPIAKMILVYGKIVALGTEEEPIIFDTYQPDSSYRWEGIHFFEGAPKSSFEHCYFKRTYIALLDYMSGIYCGALRFNNGRFYIRYCTFETNKIGIAGRLNENAIIYGCKFLSFDLSGFHPISEFISITSTLEIPPTLIISRCEFQGVSDSIGASNVHMIALFNKYINFKERYMVKSDQLDRYTGTVSYYGTISTNSTLKLYCGSWAETDTAYCRRNIIINSNHSVYRSEYGSSGSGHLFVSDNYIYGYAILYIKAPNSDINNNIIETLFSCPVEFITSDPYAPVQPRFYNNLLRYVNPDNNNAIAISSRYSSPILFNNDIINYSCIFAPVNSTAFFYNNILDDGYISTRNSMESIIDPPRPSFYNNCLRIALSPSYTLVDNIFAAPLYTDSLAGDFTLSANSPCIDVGAYVPYMPVYDLRYYKRSVSGTNNGFRFTDIGAYEYNSVYIGGISGYVYDSLTLEAVDCAKIEIIGKLPEFSDTLGCFPYKTGAGTYTVKVSRWDYEDLIIPNVTVVEGEDTILNIPLVRSATDIEDNTLPPVQVDFALSNYPNPFNPETIISFILPESGEVTVNIYNVKGQKITNLCNEILSKGHHTLLWKGTDANGCSLASGIYFVRLETKGKSQCHKMMMVK